MLACKYCKREYMPVGHAHLTGRVTCGLRTCDKQRRVAAARARRAVVARRDGYCAACGDVATCNSTLCRSCSRAADRRIARWLAEDSEFRASTMELALDLGLTYAALDKRASRIRQGQKYE